MNKKEYFTVSEFAKLFNIKNKTLYYYDEIDLFKPEFVNEAGYRYYSLEQIYDFHVLLSIKDLNFPLSDVKNYVYNRTPEMMLDVLNKKSEDITKQIIKLQHQQESINERLDLLKENIDKPVGTFEIKDLDEKLFKAWEIHEDTGHNTNYLVWHNIYSRENKHQLNEFGYGQLTSKDNLLKENYKPSFVIAGVKQKENDNEIYLYRPKGTYLISRKKGRVLKSEPLYIKMMQYIKENNLTITGNSFELFIVDGEYSADPANRVLEIQIPIKKV